MEISFYQQTDKGRRDNNEDAVLCLHLGPGTYFFAVADGMGGAKGGEVASQLVLHLVEKHLHQHFSSHFVEAGDLKSLLGDVFYVAHQSIEKYTKEHPDYSGMGTTLTALFIMGEAYVWGNLGDSRIYQIQEGNASRITKDHTLLEDPPEDSPFEDLVVPDHMQNALTRVVDGSYSKPDIYPEKDASLKTQGNISWLLCSDGLVVSKTDPLENSLMQICNAYAEIRQAGEALVQFALDQGSTDNISLILIRSRPGRVISGPATRRIQLKQPTTRRKGSKLIKRIGFLALLLFLLSFVAALLVEPNLLKQMLQKIGAFCLEVWC